MKRRNVVLVVDGGGRGAALVHKYSLSPDVSKIIAIPGNDLMQVNSSILVKTYQHLKTTSIKEILEICKKEKVDLADVAQDNAVEAGLVDQLIKAGIKAVGPTKDAGQIEWDKAWAREFMQKYATPCPKFKICKSQKDGINFVKKYQGSWFVKAAGLAEGKGVIPAIDVNAAIKGIKQMKKFGPAGKIYLLEEWLVGEEFSAFALSDGKNFQIAGFAQDHKRVNNGDLGENTGGMGCVSNPSIIDVNIKKQTKGIISKTLEGLRRERRSYRGVLYLGGIVVKGKVFVIEFNARWGDPEAEVLLPSIKNDLFQISEAIASNNIKNLKIERDKKVRIAIAGVSKGYPKDYLKVKGKKIFGIEKLQKIPGVKFYGAGIKKVGKNYLASGGRLFYIVGEGKDILEARQKAYMAMSKLSVEGNNLHYRTDIGWRDVKRLKG
jgi:phosphoribosylamine---glycine ligase